ncbi:MAG: 2-oxo acid dehydrogenase subunit E2 [Clostridiales bacterium]|jgi:pyruvate dehydrogenase E2 component (dihydrolipoamide acetyltransferase)|nr:2-oxo acid dehydrogenase subunit E2 [Clostridiales bacterium]
MAVPVIMPRQGQSVESCIITEWFKNPGDAVQAGDILFTYETDKASFEEKAKVDGILLARFFETDDDVPCLIAVAVIGRAGESYRQFDPRETGVKPESDAVTAQAATPANAVFPTVAFNAAPDAAPPYTNAPPRAGAAPVARQDTDDVIVLEASELKYGPAARQMGGAPRYYSPRARAAAARLHVDITKADSSGPHGRVIERDVLAIDRFATEQAPPEQASPEQAPPEQEATPATTRTAAAQQRGGAYTDVKHSNVRRVVARGMLMSLQNTAQLTNQLAFDATSILRLRKEIKTAAATDANMPNITLNDMLLFACARVLLRHPGLNAHFYEDKLRQFHHVHLGMAVDTPRGLLVPTLFDAHTKSLRELSQQAKALAAQAQAGDINPDLLTGATFTISNLGALGTEFFTPILNPPQVGILGVGCAVERVRTVDGAMQTFPAMGLSLTYDHRGVDGAPAARFLQELKRYLESFTAMLV